ncbi:MAG: serine/threonine protein kinase [Gemmataceae bacterium]|nr:serine/threonine protein kinase [Gemmataceae bacterium]
MDAVAFVSQLRASGLLEDAEMESSVHELSQHSASARELARALVRRKVLTRFQADRLLSGKGAELALGPYLLCEPLGAHVFRAIHTALGREVAVKLMLCPPTRKRAARARFERETSLAARLNHPGLATGLDAFERGRVYVLVTEWVPGDNLGRHVCREGPLAIAPACGYAVQAALALQHAHDRGLVHQGIEPGHLLIAEAPATQSLADLYLDRTGVAGRPVKVLNLGLSWRVRPQDVGRDGGNYLAPEQLSAGATPDHRSDLFGLGCCLYFALTGCHPFPPAGARGKPAVPLEELRPDVPPRLAAVIRRLMALRPAERFASALEVAEVLAPFCGAARLDAFNRYRSETATVADLRSVHTAPALALQQPQVQFSPGDLRRGSWRRRVAVAVGMGVVAALLVHLLYLRG